ncbi:MAG: methyltransferase domain-containing protein [Chloroflexi bacterium]|nr:methyltransferase domain-containing protein [Chloroflexota bacterium]
MKSETEFYNHLAEFFDVMTDWQSRLAVELPFLEAVFARHDARSILDCACGTGGHSIALAQRGYRVSGADISAQMIARAQTNAQRAGLEIPFAVARFQDLYATFHAQFDAVLCLGNSLPHVLTDAAALESLLNMRVCLRSGGALILHNLNYDKRWKEKPRWFAVNSGTLENRETLVWRFADYSEEREAGGEAQMTTSHASRITFNIALFTKNDNAWSVEVQSTPQRPYRQSEIELLLRRAGFREIAFYGNLQGDPFDAETSPDLVAVAMV